LEHLDTYGWVLFENLVTAAECETIAGLYDEERHFRSRVVMARHGFGRGEYKYFTYPLPELVARLRSALYPWLAPVANRWNESTGSDGRRHFCCDTRRTITTPCIRICTPPAHLSTADGILLSKPDTDFTGGEFVLIEQRPRMQSRAEVIPLSQGGGVLFAVHNRPAQGKRGTYRVNMRHGVSRVRSGRRHTVGIIFHDAK
jgi:hypothetical protein